MSRLISDILQASEPHFSHSIRELEEKSERKAHDVRLLSEFTQHKKDILNHLGLDVNDTTAKELFYALRHKGLRIHESLEADLGIDTTTSPDDVLTRAIAYIDAMDIKRDVWVLKHAVVKSQLAKNPPKRLMKALGWRSIDSVLKRTNAREVITLSYQLERTEWQKNMRANIKKSAPSDYNVVRSELFAINHERTTKLEKSGFKRSRMVLPNYETGSIAVLCSDRRFSGDTLAIVLSLLHALYDLQVYSAYFKYKSAQKTFSQDVHRAVCNGLPQSKKGAHIGWRALQKYMNSSPHAFDHFEQPHFSRDDVAPAPLSKFLNEYAWPAQDHGFVLYDDTRPISLNLFDVITSTSNNLAHDHAISVYAQRNLSEEIGVRYLQHPQVLATVIEFIDSGIED